MTATDDLIQRNRDLKHIDDCIDLDIILDCLERAVEGLLCSRNGRCSKCREGERSMSNHYAETEYGFEWGSAKMERGFADDKKGWVSFLLTTPKHESGIQIYVTKTGKVRVYSFEGEWVLNEKSHGS